MKPVDIARRKDGTVDKTPYNVLKGTNPPKLESLEKLAKSMSVPLWVLMVPGIPDELCDDPGLKAVETLVKDYLGCDKAEREHIAGVAAAYADICKKKKAR